MGKLIYSVIGSLDGYLNDEHGRYAWAVPGEDLVWFLDEVLAGVGTHLYGRRMYQEMAVWETDPQAAEQSPASARFAEVWRAADKVVFSTTLPTVTTRRTRLERSFDAGLVRRLKAEASGDLTVDGPTLAASALREHLVDEVQRVVVPVVVGGGTPIFPPGVRLDLELTEERRFDRGLVFLRYAVR